MRSLARVLLGATALVFVAFAAGAEYETNKPGPGAAAISESSGAAKLGIPIEAPRGTGGFAPTLMLQYSSLGEDGVFGVGWSFQLGEIRRATRFGTPSYTSQDVFELDGELLVPSSSESGCYFTRTETFRRILLTGNGWEVTFPNGNKARFGWNQESRIRVGGDTTPNDDNGGIFRWLLTELEDVNGNVIQFKYDRSIDPGTAYPKSINYAYRGGVAQSPLRRIEFLLGTRDDHLLSYAGGAYSLVTRRVVEIRSSVGSTAFRRLRLYYDEDPQATGRSRLTSSRLFGSSCPGTVSNPEANCPERMPLQTYEYTDLADTVPPGTSTHWASYSGTTPRAFDAENSQGQGQDGGVRVGDVNGDGWQDLLYAREGQGDPEVYLGSPSGWSSPDPTWSGELQGLSYYRTRPRVVSGSIDCGTTQLESRDVWFARALGTSLAPKEMDEAQLADVNGDGRVDILISIDYGPCESHKPDEVDPAVRRTAKVWLNTGSGWSEHAGLSSLPAAFRMVSYSRNGSCDFVYGVTSGPCGYRSVVYPLGTSLIDPNGDGRLDLVTASQGPYYGPASSVANVNQAWINTGESWQPASQYAFPLLTTDGKWLTSAATVGLQPGDTGVRFADLNGDGLTDILKGQIATGGFAVPANSAPSYAAAGVWINTGAGWCYDGAPQSPCAMAARYRLPAGQTFARVKDFGANSAIVDNSLVLADLNGDGFLDLLRADGSGGLNPPPAGFFAAWLQDPASASVWQVAPEFVPPSSMPLVRRDREGGGESLYRTGVRLFDIDANGTADLVKNYDGSNAQFRSLASLADRLAVHGNGQGASWEFTYQTGPQQRVSGKETTAASHAAEMGETSVGIPRWYLSPVVTALRVTSGDQQFDTTIAYAGPRWDGAVRSSLGFRLVDKVQPDGALIRSFFYQAPGRTGQLSRHAVWDGSQKIWQADSTWNVSLASGTASDVFIGRLASESERVLYASTDAGATQTTNYLYHPSYGFNFVERIEIRRPTSNLDVVRTPKAADTTRWIAGLVASETQEYGGVTYAKSLHQYDDRGRLFQTDQEIRDRAVGAPLTGTATTSWTYDDYGNVKTRTDPGDRIERFCHDGDSSAGGQPCPTGGAGAHAVLAGVQDRLGQWTRVTSDPATGEVRQIVRFNGDVVAIGVDGFGRPTMSSVDPTGPTAVQVLERRAYFDGLATPAGQPFVETTQFAKAGEVGPVRTATYLDGLGRVAREVQPSPTGWFGTGFRYDYAGRTIRETLPQDCDADPHCLALAPATAPAARILAYDRLGRPRTETTPLGVRAFAYQRRLEAGVPFDTVLVKEPRGSLVQRLLDRERTARVEECSNTVPPSATDPGSSCSSPATTQYFYDPTGELRTIRDALGFDFAYTYDTLGRTRTITDPDATGSTVMTYYVTGTVYTSRNARNQTTTYVYDALDRVTDVTRPGTEPAVHVDYDPVSRGPSLVREGPSGSPVQTIEMGYDGFGRENRRKVTVAQRTMIADFRYDLLDRIEEIVYPNGWSAVYTYQGAYLDRVCGKAPSDSVCGLTEYYVGESVYDDLGRLSRTGMAGVAINRTYHPQNHLPATLKVISGSTRLMDLAYPQYDEAGNIRQIDDLRPDKATDGIDASATYSYYPDRDRLMSHNLGGSTKFFAYDALGNLIGRDVPSTTTQNQFIKNGFPHRLDYYSRSNGTTTLGYDADGNVTRRGSQYFSYDAQSRLKCVGPSIDSCTDAFYRYDPLGDARTFEQTAAGERLYLGELFEWHKGSSTSSMHVLVDGRRIATIERATDSLREAWLPPFWEPPVPWSAIRWATICVLTCVLLALAVRLGIPAQAARRPVPVAVSLAMALLLVPGQSAWATPPPPSGVVKRWFVEDHVGSASLVLDQSGNVVDRKVFEPFGKVFKEFLPAVSSPRFTGKRVSAQSSLYDFGARWYDPEIGRFQQIDPVVQSPFAPVTLNAYGYAGNNPTNLVDPDGRGFLKALAIASIVLGFVLMTVAPYLGGVVPGTEIALAGVAGVGGASSVAQGIALSACDSTCDSPPEQPPPLNETPPPVPRLGGTEKEKPRRRQCRPQRVAVTTPRAKIFQRAMSELRRDGLIPGDYDPKWDPSFQVAYKIGNELISSAPHPSLDSDKSLEGDDQAA